MPHIKYQDIALRGPSLAVVETANAIIAEYQAQGFDLTLRQLYYQFVARGIIPNNDKEYKRLGSVVNDGRLSGLIDWDAIQDRTRSLRKLPAWEKPQDILEGAAFQYRLDLWEGQPYRVECWIEKDALVGVIQRVCDELGIPYFSCRGYTSQSEMWIAAQRLLRHQRAGQTPVILHLGDHDPSGIDMTRDVTDRLSLFTYGEMQVERLALNMDQVEELQPPPNPAKITDSRATAYIAEYGDESWELDALEPAYIADLITTAIMPFRDNDLMEEIRQRQEADKRQLRVVAERWEEAIALLKRQDADTPEPEEEE